jgi:hypothetical protein
MQPIKCVLSVPVALAFFCLGDIPATAMPSHLWSGVQAIQTRCAIKDAPRAEVDLICDEFAQAVAVRAPFPVNQKPAGPADLIIRFEGRRLPNGVLSGSIKAERLSLRSEDLERSRPIPISFSDRGSPLSRHRALGGALDQLLPWRQRRPYRRIPRAS